MAAENASGSCVPHNDFGRHQTEVGGVIKFWEEFAKVRKASGGRKQKTSGQKNLFRRDDAHRQEEKKGEKDCATTWSIGQKAQGERAGSSAELRVRKHEHVGGKA